MKKILPLSILLLGIVGTAALTLSSAPVYASTLGSQAACKGNQYSCVCTASNPDPQICGDPAATGAAVIDCDNNGTNDKGCSLFTKYVNPLIRLMAGLAGIAVVIGIIYGGIQYSASGSDPKKTAKAKGHIRNSVIAFIFFLFLYALLKFLIPGGNLITG